MLQFDLSQLPGIALFSLKGKSAIISGGTKGLGLAMAAGLVERSGAWYSYNGERAQGAEGLNRLFAEKEDIFVFLPVKK